MGNCISSYNGRSPKTLGKRNHDEIKASKNEKQSAIPETATPTLLPGERKERSDNDKGDGGTSSSTFVTQSKLVTRGASLFHLEEIEERKAGKCDVKEEAGSSSSPYKFPLKMEIQAQNEEEAGPSSSCSFLSDGNEEEEEEILNKETLHSIKDLNEAMKWGNVDVRNLLDRLLAFINHLESGNQQFKTEAPPNDHENRFDELINKPMKKIVDRLVAIKKTGIPKQLFKLTAKLLEGVGKRNSPLVVVSFLGWSLNRGLQIRENNEICMKFLEHIRILLILLQSHISSFQEDTPSDSPLTHTVQEITNGILVCCSYREGNFLNRFFSVESVEDDLKRVNVSLANAIGNLRLQLNMETNENVCAIKTKLESQMTMQCNFPQSVDAVGIDDRIAAVIESLEMENDQKEGVAVILHGPGGVGKSTLGENVVHSLKQKSVFEFKYASVTVSSDKHDTTAQAMELQKQIIRQLSEEKYKVTTVAAGKGKLKKIFLKCPCFLFVDNIVNANQLSHLLPDLRDCSDYMLRILVASCDLEVRTQMPFPGDPGDLIKPYCVDPLSNLRDCVMLFKEKAGLTDAELDDKVTEIANLCHGSPILLSLVGKDLKFHRQQEGYCDMIIKKLEVADYRGFNYERDIEKVLLSVFTLLDESTQKAFLDICFFFYGWDWDQVRCIIGKISMQKLDERSMIRRSHDDKVIVHSLLKGIAVNEARRQKTRIIINKEDMERAPNEEDEETSENAEEKEITVETEKLEISEIIQNLDSSLELGNIEALFIYGDARKEVLIDPKKLPSLRLFRSSNMNVKFETNCSASYFNQLQFLEINQKAWGNVRPLLLKKRDDFSTMEVLSLNSFEDLHQSPPAMSKFKQLKRLDLSRVSLTTLPPKIEVLKYLEFLRLAGCHGIIDLQDLGMLNSLVDLKLWKCEALVRLPSSIRSLIRLVKLELGYCQSIDSLPPDISALRCLERLDLRNCIKLKSLPPEFGDLSNLKSIDMSNCTGIVDLPNEMGKLTSLEELKLTGCSSLSSVPPEFGDLTNLKSIDLSNCTAIEDLPNEMGELASLEELKLTGCSSLKHLPSSVSGLLKLKLLEMNDCDNIETLPEDIRMLASLEYLLIVSKKLRHLPPLFQGLTSLKKLHIKCEALESLPEDVGMVASLKELVLIDCSALQCLPSSVSGLKRQLDMLVILHCENITAHKVIEVMRDHTIEHFDVRPQQVHSF